MDSLTHLAAGVITPLAFRKAPRTGSLLLFGLLAGQLPDIDLLAGSGPHATFTLHRGMTHSFGALLIFAAILAGLLKLSLSQIRLKDTTVRIEEGGAVINRADDWGFGQMYIAAFLGLALHVYLDCMTTYGTQIFWPISNYRVALPALFIIDPILTVPLFTLMIYCLFGFKNQARLERQVKCARIGLVWAICYPLVCLGISGGLTYKLNRKYTEVGTTVEKIHITPVLFSPFAWKAIAENEREYHMAWITIFRPFSQPDFTALPYPKVNQAEWERIQEGIGIFSEFDSFATFITVSETHRDINTQEFTFKDLRYLYSVPNYIIEQSGYTKGLFNMQLRVNAQDGLAYAWRYLPNGSDDSPQWNGIRPPVNFGLNR